MAPILVGFSVEAAKSKRAKSDDAPTTASMRPVDPATRKAPTTDEKKVRRRIRATAADEHSGNDDYPPDPPDAIRCHECGTLNDRQADDGHHNTSCGRCSAELRGTGYPSWKSSRKDAARRVASFTSPGYYVIAATGAPVDGPYDTYSVAIAHLNGRAGVQYFQEPQGAHTMQPFPPQLQQVNGSLGKVSKAVCPNCGEDSIHWRPEDSQRGGEDDTDEGVCVGCGYHGAGEEFDADSSEHPFHTTSTRKNQNRGSRKMFTTAHVRDDWEDSLIFTASDDDKSSNPFAKSDEDKSDDDEKSKSQSDDDDDDSSDDDDGDGDGDGDDDSKDSSSDSDDDDKDSDSSDKSDSDDDAPPWAKKSKKVRVTEPIQVTEARLLQAMALATPTEARRLMADLTTLRRAASLRHQADREVDLADSFIRDTLTPVSVHEHHTAATDWIAEMADNEVSPDSVQQHMIAEGSLWFGRVSPAVIEDRQEYLAQADGLARRSSSQFGSQRDLAYRTFMDHVGFLRARVAADEYGEALPDEPPNWQTPANPAFTLPLLADELGENLNPQNSLQPPMLGEALPLDNGISGTQSTQMIGLWHQASEREYRPPQGQQSWTLGDGEDSLSGMHPHDLQANMDYWTDNPHGLPQGQVDEAKRQLIGEWRSRQGSRHQASEMFDEPVQSYSEYQGELSEQAATHPLTEAAYPGSLAATSPEGTATSPSSAVARLARYVPSYAPGTPVLAITEDVAYRAARAGVAPSQVHLYVQAALQKNATDFKNPLFPDDREQSHEQSGEAQSSLPLTPEGPSTTDHLDFLTDFPQTGPGEIPSSRVRNGTQPQQAQAVLRAQAARSGHHVTVTPAPQRPQVSLACRCGMIGHAERPEAIQAAVDHHFAQALGWGRNGPRSHGFEDTEAELGSMHLPNEPIPEDEDDRRRQGSHLAAGPLEGVTEGGPEGPIPVGGVEEALQHGPNGEMFPYEMGGVGDVPRGAADVANVVTPGGPQGYPQPTQNKQSAFRMVGVDENSEYMSQAARDAQAASFGGKSYWDYLDQSAKEHHEYHRARGDHEKAKSMLTRSLSEALRGNEGD